MAGSDAARSQFLTYLSNPQRWNRYHYALNNPLLYTDPYGEDVTIYYRPPKAGEKNDYGHFFIYARNDETGESAYFDFYVEGGETHLGEVDQSRIDAHASLTIETTAEQEQAILDGIKEAQNSVPNYDVSYDVVLLNSDIQCTTMSNKLLSRGGINLDGGVPGAAWHSAMSQYGAPESRGKPAENWPGRSPRFYVPGRSRSGSPPSQEIGREHGRDPRGQARRVDPNATNNRDLRFKDGVRLN